MHGQRSVWVWGTEHLWARDLLSAKGPYTVATLGETRTHTFRATGTLTISNNIAPLKHDSLVSDNLQSIHLRKQLLYA